MTATRVRCTASGQKRAWHSPEWSAGRGTCPDCGDQVEVWVRGTDRAPFAKTKAHKAPAGVEPAPYRYDDKSTQTTEES